MRAESAIWGSEEAQAWNLEVSQSRTRKEVDFLEWVFENLAKRRVRKVLDLGCGTGRIAVELAVNGFEVTGVDKFDTVLGVARQNARSRGAKARFVRTPLEELSVDGDFDAAYSILDPFNYIHEEAALSRTLAKVHALLRQGGVLVVDLANFAAIYGREKKVVIRTTKGAGWIVRRRVHHRVDDVNMLWYHLEENEMRYEGQTRKWTETHVLRMWNFREFSGQLATNGFDGIRLFGYLKRGCREARAHAPRLVIVANKAQQDVVNQLGS